MLKTICQEAAEILWLMSMISGLSLLAVTIAFAIVSAT
jgi:hypothetical protein